MDDPKETLITKKNMKTNAVGEGDGELHVMGLVFAIWERQREGCDRLRTVGEETRHPRRLVLAFAFAAIYVCWRL